LKFLKDEIRDIIIEFFKILSGPGPEKIQIINFDPLASPAFFLLEMSLS